MPTTPSGRATAWSRGTRFRKGFDRVIVLEDDVFFYRDWDTNVPRIKRAMDSVPAGWWGLYLGHLPIQAYFVSGGLLRARSGCTHAYLGNRPLLNWLATTTPMASRRTDVAVDWPVARCSNVEPS